MKRSFHTFLKIICLLGFVLLFWGYPESAQSAQVGIIDGSNALNVVGQIDSAGAVSYLKGGPNSGPNNRGFSQPRFVTIDTTNHRLFVSDRENNRVLVFNLNSSDQLVDYTADFVLGQANFDSAVAGLTQSGLYWPEGVAYGVISATQYLFVSDSNNSRIMVFDVTSISNGENAVKVLGQANFTSGAVGTTQSTLNAPRGLHYDGAQWLFVADFGNHRVMVFDVGIDGIANGENALKVIGQSNFTSGSANRGGSVAANSLNFPTDVFYAPNHFFYVSDQSNNRVLRFDFTSPAGSIPDNVSADKVLGQANFTSGTSNRGGAAGNNTLSSPAGLAFRSSDSTLFAGDQGNNRVMVFEVAAITNGEAAINVLGQPNFTTTSSVTDVSHVGPMVVGLGYAATSNELFVVNQDNNRVMVFNVNPGVITDGESAINVLGQLDTTPTIIFTKGGQNNGPLNIGFNSPHAMEIDTTNHRLFVADRLNNRVLVFNLDTSDTLVDATADFVLGQANFVTNSPGTTQSTLNNPEGLAYQSSTSRLFVSDFWNHRIMIFDVAAITNGENAINVLGQALFTTNSIATTSSGLNRPMGLAFNSTNNWLYVADSNNNRVMIFDVTAVGNGDPAMYVLGQANFTSAGIGTTQSTLNIPVAVAYASSNKRLYVADSDNRRVMVFNVDPAVITQGANAINVLGQALFTTNTAATTQSGFQHPQGLGYDNNNSYLFVSDATGASNHRVMVFDVTAITNGENAVNVLGQPNFTATGAATTQSRLNSPEGLFFNPVNGQLWVADEDNHRLMVFVGAAAPPTVSVAPVFVSQAANGSGQVTLSVQVNDATPSSGVQLKVEHSIDGGTSWRTSYINSVTASASPTPNLANSTGSNTYTITRHPFRYNGVDYDDGIALHYNNTGVIGNDILNITQNDQNISAVVNNPPQRWHLALMQDGSTYRTVYGDDTEFPTQSMAQAAANTLFPGSIIRFTHPTVFTWNGTSYVYSAPTGPTVLTTFQSGSPAINVASTFTEAAYQVGTTTRVNVTAGANTLNPLIWDSKNILNENGTLNDQAPTVLIRVTPSDGVTIGTFQQTATVFNLDNMDPSPPTSFTSPAQTSSTVTLNWSAVTETNFNHYEIWYGTNQSNVQNRVANAVTQEWDPIDDAALATRTTTSTTITGLGSGIGYYFQIWAVDNYGNENTVDDVRYFTSSGSSIRTNVFAASVNLKINLGDHRDKAFLRIINKFFNPDPKEAPMVKDRVTIRNLMHDRAGRPNQYQFHFISEIKENAAFKATLLQLVSENPELRNLLRGQRSDHLILEVWEVGDRTKPVATNTVSTNLFGEATVSLPALPQKSYDFTVRKPFGLRQTLTGVTLESSLDLNFKSPLRVGDVNGDGKINLTDFQFFIDNFKKFHATPGDYDLNEDGAFDLNDFPDIFQGLREGD